MEQSNKKNLDEKLQRLIKNNVLNNFKPLFADRVIRKINNQNYYQMPYELIFDQLILPFKRVALSIILILIFLMSYNIIDDGRLTLTSALDIPEISLQDAIDPINSIEWSE